MTIANADVSVGAHVGAARVTIANGDADTHVDATHVTIANADVSAGAHVGAARAGAAQKLDAAILRTQAKAALTGLGWKPAIAHAAVAAAAAGSGAAMTLEQLIRADYDTVPCLRHPYAA